MLKKISILCFFALGIFLINTTVVFAVKLAPFPDSKSLQPMPSDDIRPNISGNVNFSSSNIENTDTETSAQVSAENQPPNNPTQENQNQTESASDTGYKLPWIISGLLLLVFLAITLARKKIQRAFD